MGLEYSVQAGDSLRKIVKSVGGLQEMTGEISTATAELAHSADEISTDIIAIERSSSETVRAVASIARESETLARLSSDQNSEISHFTFHDDGRIEPVRSAANDREHFSGDRKGQITTFVKALAA